MKASRVLCVPLVLASIPALAWGPKGHPVIAAIAWQRLSTATRLQVAQILLAGDKVRLRDPRPGQPAVVDYVPRAPGGAMHPVYLDKTIQPKFIACSNWADDIKHGTSAVFSSAIKWQNDNSDLTGVSPNERKDCKSWHYLDLPITRPDDTRPHLFAKSNAQRAIGLAIQALRAEQTKAQPDRRKEAFWLYFLIHIVGDLHQPLHCVSSYLLNPQGDDGGNGFHIDDETSLHSFWDAGIDHAIDAQHELRGSSASSVAMHWLDEPAFQPTTVEATDLVPMHWIQKGRDLAIQDVYTIPEHTQPSDPYVARQVEVCKRQALLGGYRLAAILNKVMKRR